MNWRRYFERERRDDDLAREVESYLGHEMDRNLERGMTKEEARLAARRKFGNPALVREAVYNMNTLNVPEALWQDLRYALRQLRLNPGFALTAILTLALGIGANTAIFTLTDQILLRLLPVERPEELVQLRAEGGRVGSQSGDGLHTFSHPTFLALREATTVFSGLTGREGATASLTGQDRNDVVYVDMVAGNYFDVLGVKSCRGRLLTLEDDRVKNGQPVAVLQYDFWRSRFAAKPDIVGSTIRLNGSPFTVVGIGAPGFEGTNVGFPSNVWVPVTMKPAITPTDTNIENERYAWFYLFARLKPGVSIAQAEAAMKVTYRQRQEEELKMAYFQKYPQARERFLKQTFKLVPAERGQSSLRFQFERPLILLQWLVGAVLLIACSNVAGLLLARGAARQREMAIRGALGAGRGALVRQLLVESALLACAGGLAGVLISNWATRALVYMVAADPSRMSLTTSADLRILVFATVLTLLTTVLFGLLPAWQSSRVPATTLKESAGAIAGGHSHVRLRKMFVGVQIGLSTLLLIGAGLFARTLGNLRNIELGFDSENIATFFVRPATVYDNQRKLHVYRSLIEGLAAVPGVKAVGANTNRLFTGGRSDGSIRLPGIDAKGGDATNSYFNNITPGYFAALGIPIKAGRDLTWRDWGSSRQRCLVNEALVDEYFSGRNPGGTLMGRGGADAPLEFEIVGVFGDARYADVRGKIPRQTFFAMDNRIGFVAGVNVYARIQGDPRAVMPQLREQVRRIDANLVVSDMRTLDDQLNLRLANERMVSFLSAGFALLAALLAVTGLYGVLSFVVARRNREIGIRMALGAERGRVIRLVLREMVAVILVGIAAGVVAGIYCGRFVETQLFGVKASDLAVFLTSAAVLSACSLGAAFLPAWRASRLDPTVALRQE